MRNNILWSVVVVGLSLLLISGCAKSTQMSGITASADALYANQNGNPVDTTYKALTVVISSEEEWKVASSAPWLTTNAEMGGITRTVVSVKVQPNLTGKERAGVLTFQTQSHSIEVKVNQQGGDGIDISTVRYDIPVIFHVLYNEEDKINTDTVRKKFVLNSEEAQKVLEYINELHGQQPPKLTNQIYRGLSRKYQPTTDVYYMPKETNIRFVLATRKPDGSRVTNAGIDAVQIKEKSLDPKAVMDDREGGIYHSMAWPINKYVNVFIFPFSKQTETGNQVTLGIAHLPYALSKSPIEGLRTLSPQDEKKISEAGGLTGFSNYNHCVVINSDAFEWRTWQYTFLKASLGKNTVAHELGHYLGLFHVFSEVVNKENNTIILNSCEDTDHCADTPTYNRHKYDADRRSTIAGGVTHVGEIYGLLQRYNCSSMRFESTNIMDYDYSYSDEFTPDQIARMRKVLYSSYTVPGTKIIEPSTTRCNTTPLRVVGNPIAVACYSTLK